MKKYLIIFIALVSSIQAVAQSSYYETQWKKVQELVQKQKSKDAEKVIREIMTRAKSEKNVEQSIKSLILLRKAVEQRDEKDKVNAIQEFEKEITGLSFPAKNIMHSMIASLYNTYYQNNRWKIYKRTELVKKSDLKFPKDIETWTPQLFFNKIQEQFDASLTRAKDLQKFPTAKYPELITKGKLTESLRPTLFDVLVHRAIDFYQNKNVDITKAAYYFKLKDENAFASAYKFANAAFTTKDNFSTKYIALTYLQLATRFHLNDSKADALLDIETKRLTFAKNHFDGRDGDKKYVAALKKLIATYPNNPLISKPMLKLAQHLALTDAIQAKDYASQIIEKFPTSVEFVKAKRLKQRIESPQLTLITEKADVAENNILAKLRFKNIDKVYFKIIPLTVAQFKSRQGNNRTNRTVPKGKSIRDWSIELDNENWKGKNQYNIHNTETNIDKLPTGSYAILASGNEAFSEKKSPVSYSLFQTNSLSYVVNKGKESTTLYIVNRASGQPIPNASVTRYQRKYDYNKRKNIITKVDTKQTDKNGQINYKSISNYQSYTIEIKHNKETLWADNAFSNSRYRKPSDRTNLFLFTDRAIYRPGQTIYFKGIYINSKGDRKKHETVAGKKIELVLKDAKYKEVKKQSFTTNEFGSINGTFSAPKGLLNGRFTIYHPNGSKQIRVEEYKRPKFEVKMQALKKNIKLGDLVSVTGEAKAYAGNKIDGARVQYIVKRKVRWPYYWCFYYWGAPNNNQEIVMTQGQTTTDAEGKFSVSFLAEGDENIDPRTKPFYDFEVSADVTDINGEVRSNKKRYSFSKESLMLSLVVPNKVDFNSFNNLFVQTRNTQGEFTAADVKIEFIKLQAPNRFLKKRMWKAPKHNLLSKERFNKYFPDYEYKVESNPLFWKEGKTVWQKTIRTEEGQRTTIQKVAPNSGYYLVKATSRDKDGNVIEEKKVVRMINTSRKKALPNEALFSYKAEKTFQPGDKTNVSISSAFRNAYIHKTIARQNKIAHAWDQKTESFSINEADRGGFATSFFTIKNNRLYQEQVRIAVPWLNKDLKISYETFRDKILPGSQQEWKIKISGNKKEKVGAELLATMYDASLDAFAKNNWNSLKLYGNNYNRVQWNTNAFGLGINRMLYKAPQIKNQSKYRSYPRLNMYGLEYGFRGGIENYAGGRADTKTYSLNAVEVSESVSNAETPAAPSRSAPRRRMAKMTTDNLGKAANESEADLVGNKDRSENKEKEEVSLDKVSIRSNMSETAFFFPNLRTDENSNIVLSFTAPDALTRWNVKTLVHTPDLQTAYSEKTLVTQKQLMLTPNHPRFMRENDRMMYSTKLTNLSEKNLKGIARLEIINAKTNKKINGLFNNDYNDLGFELATGKSKELSWNLNIPTAFTDPVIVRLVAKADNFSDGEQKIIPLLLNSMLVTETVPLPVRANTTKNFKLDKLINSAQSNTLKHHKLTVEYTSNPAWYAVQALPYLTDYPYECSEQTFNRYYANALASHIANSSPRIKTIFSNWKDTDTAALLSNLEKNQELKSALLQETPWVLDANNESDQKKMIANLFNMERMSSELASAVNTLAKLQTSNGGFAWFKGMRDNRFITQYIITGIARLQKLGVADASQNDKIQSIITKALPYLDARMREDYAYLLQKGLLNKQNISYRQIQYLYMRSFFNDRKMSAVNKIAFSYFKNQGKKYWTKQNKYMQGMLSIALYRYDEKSTALDIIEALRQNSIQKEEMGLYWKEFNQGSYWWYRAPIEAQSLLIEAFTEVKPTKLIERPYDEVDEMRVWLLKQKQTQQWKTTKATADACYALLLGGADWLGAQPNVSMRLGTKKINLSDYKQEAGTGYTKFSFDSDEVKAEMGDIQVSVKANQKIGTTWGAVYWQYFEQLDKITEAETPLSLKKQVYKVVNGDRGEQLVLVGDNGKLKVGDKIKIRIELRVDRAMEFVHMKDMRGACFEPTNVLSNYKYQNGLGYYESTKDASTQFFFDRLRPGTYVFESPMFATLRGNYSNGITTIQCMYAPEFSSHSEGIRVKVD